MSLTSHYQHHRGSGQILAVSPPPNQNHPHKSKICHICNCSTEYSPMVKGFSKSTSSNISINSSMSELTAPSRSSILRESQYAGSFSFKMGQLTLSSLDPSFCLFSEGPRTPPQPPAWRRGMSLPAGGYRWMPVAGFKKYPSAPNVFMESILVGKKCLHL